MESDAKSEQISDKDPKGSARLEEKIEYVYVRKNMLSAGRKLKKSEGLVTSNVLTSRRTLLETAWLLEYVCPTVQHTFTSNTVSRSCREYGLNG